MPALFPPLVVISILWFVVSSLSIYPHSQSYFNESIGGPIRGPEFLSGSSVDWGQDVFYAMAAAERRLPGAVSVRTIEGKPAKVVWLMGHFVPGWEILYGTSKDLYVRVCSRRPLPPDAKSKCLSAGLAQGANSKNVTQVLTTYALESYYIQNSD